MSATLLFACGAPNPRPISRLLPRTSVPNPLPAAQLASGSRCAQELAGVAAEQDAKLVLMAAEEGCLGAYGLRVSA
jgi:hypothetical protein